MGEIREAFVVNFTERELDVVEIYHEKWGDVDVTKTIRKYKPQTLGNAGVLTYDSNLDYAVIKGLFKHDAAYDNQD